MDLGGEEPVCTREQHSQNGTHSATMSWHQYGKEDHVLPCGCDLAQEDSVEELRHDADDRDDLLECSPILHLSRKAEGFCLTPSLEQETQRVKENQGKLIHESKIGEDIYATPKQCTPTFTPCLRRPVKPKVINDVVPQTRSLRHLFSEQEPPNIAGNDIKELISEKAEEKDVSYEKFCSFTMASMDRIQLLWNSFEHTVVRNILSPISCSSYCSNGCHSNHSSLVGVGNTDSDSPVPLQELDESDDGASWTPISGISPIPSSTEGEKVENGSARHQNYLCHHYHCHHFLDHGSHQDQHNVQRSSHLPVEKASNLLITSTPIFSKGRGSLCGAEAISEVCQRSSSSVELIPRKDSCFIRTYECALQESEIETRSKEMNTFPSSQHAGKTKKFKRNDVNDEQFPNKILNRMKISNDLWQNLATPRRASSIDESFFRDVPQDFGLSKSLD